MRWHDLFHDLEGQYAELEAAQQRDELPDRVRGEIAAVRLIDRLRAVVGRRVTVTLGTGETVSGQLLAAGADWLLVQERPGREALLPLGAVAAVTGLAHLADRRGPAVSAPGTSPGSAALRFPGALRALARDRAGVVVVAAGAAFHGTLERVGADYVEVRETPPGEVRGGGSTRPIRAVALHAISTVRTDGGV